ncbi:MAG TPA: hypothetical protein PKB07_17525 [Flavilitoribacter sp.]|nr:hypothetical protein [Flavilitoribacter sp.]
MSNFRNSWQICLKTGCLLFLMAAQTCMPGALNVELIQEKVVVEPHEVLPSNARTGFHGDAEIRARNTGFMEVGWSVRAGYLFPKRLLIGGYLSAGLGVAYRLESGLKLKIRAGAGYFMERKVAKKQMPKSVPLP